MLSGILLALNALQVGWELYKDVRQFTREEKQHLKKECKSGKQRREAMHSAVAEKRGKMAINRRGRAYDKKHP